MKYTLINAFKPKANQCLVLGYCDKEPLPSLISTLDKTQQTLLTQLVKKLKKEGDFVFQSEWEGMSLLIIHCGEIKKYTQEKLRKRVNNIAETLIKHRISEALLALPLIEGLEPNAQLESMLLTMDAARYQFLEFKSKNKEPHALKAVSFYLPGAKTDSLKASVSIAECISLTKMLADRPANHCTPSYLAEQAKDLGKAHPELKIKIRDEKAIRALNMGALLAVSQGSHEPPRFIELNYQAGGKQAPIVLVGKGITFDAGGISLKPADGMHEMKYDMGGAASVLGVLKACALLKLPLNVIGLIASAENLPGGNAIKPGDVVTGMSGQTIEIINTDAEGRLVLSDALTYAEQFKPRFVIDIATLTGAIIVALGRVHSGLMTNNEALANRIQSAGLTSQDTTWRMPLDDAYQEAIDSPVADILNSTYDRVAGSVTAACFLSRFTENYPWAHLDIAGTAWNSGSKRQATGRPVRLLIELLRQAVTDAC